MRAPDDQSSPPTARLVLLGSMVVVTLAQAMPAAALPTITQELGHRDLVAWPIGISLLTSTMAAPLLGRAGEIHGRRTVLQLSLVGVLVTGLLSGLAPTMPALIACRAFFGIASGGLIAISAASVSEVVPRSLYARFQGLTLAATSIASIGAPLLSGLIIFFVSWRWVFLATIFIPLILLPLSRRLPRGQRHARTIDLGGAVLLPIAAGALLAGLQVAAHGGGLTWSVAGGLLTVGLLASAAFIVRERKASDPLVALELFRDKLFARSAVLSLLCGALLFGSSLQLQQYLQTGRGISAGRAGVLMMPLLLAVAVASVVYGRLAQRDEVGRRLLHGCLLMAAGLVLLVFEIQQLVFPGFLLATVLFGAGLGVVLPAIGTVAQLGVQPSEITRAVSVIQLTRTLGGAIGATVTGTFVAATLTQPALPGLDPAGASGRWSAPFAFLAGIGLLAVVVTMPLRAAVVTRLTPRHR